MMKSSLRTMLRRAGYDLRRYVPNNSHHLSMQLLLERLSIDLVFDVGANTGQTGEELMNSGFAGQVVSFEPLSVAHDELSRRAARHPRWHVHPRSAVGAQSGTVTIHIAENSVSSSVLPTLEAHLESAAESRTVGSETVPVIRLDDVVDAYTSTSQSILVKVDTQGFEWQVLDGAERLLNSAAAVQLELSLVPLYEGQHLWRECIDRMEANGYELYFLHPVFTDERTGRQLQWDGMFVRGSLMRAPTPGR